MIVYAKNWIVQVWISVRVIYIPFITLKGMNLFFLYFQNSRQKRVIIWTSHSNICPAKKMLPSIINHDIVQLKQYSRIYTLMKPHWRTRLVPSINMCIINLRKDKSLNMSSFMPHYIKEFQINTGRGMMRLLTNTFCNGQMSHYHTKFVHCFCCYYNIYPI